MEGSIPRKEVLSTVISSFLSVQVQEQWNLHKLSSGLTGQVKWKDGERKGSVDERLVEMSAPGLKTAREKS